MTEKLYYIDSHMKEFDAVVLDCVQDKKQWKILLDRTVFFPEGGGQFADTGMLEAEGMTVRVLDAHEKEGNIFHYTDRPLNVGEKVHGVIDWEQRFSNMQQHSGEHIVSGLIHRTFGYDNVGFHLGREVMTMDFNGPLTDEELWDIEARANAIVWSNQKVIVEFPDAETLKSMEYRSKIEIDGDVRIVTIPEADVCACCAPHVTLTGEIGIVKIVDAQNYKGGTRITMLCGNRALKDYGKKQENVCAISVELSAKQEKVAEAVQKLKEEMASVKENYVHAMGELIGIRAEGIADTEEMICLFESGNDAKAYRELTNLLVPKTSKAAAVFFGNDVEGYRYIIGSSAMDLRALAKTLNKELNGRGGGSAEMIQGSVMAKADKIKEYMNGI